MIPITVLTVSARLFVTLAAHTSFPYLSPSLIMHIMFVACFSGQFVCSHASLRNGTLRSNHSSKEIR